MSPLLCAGRKFGQRFVRQPRTSVRRHRPIGILERCENRILLTTTFGMPAASAFITPFDSPTPATSVAPTDGAPPRALAIAPEPGYGSTVVGSTATLTASVQGVPLVIDQLGGLLRHNQFDLGTLGYHSEFDFDSTLPGAQTLSSADSAITVIVNASPGDDPITLGSASAPLSSLATAFTINGHGGSDHLTLDDRADTIARRITVSPKQVTGLGGAISFRGSYDSYLHLQVLAGLANDTLSLVQSFDFTYVPTSLNGGGGVDTLNADAQRTETSVSTTQIKFELLPALELQTFIGLKDIEQVNVTNERGSAVVPLTPIPPINAFAGHSFVDAVVARFQEGDPRASAADYQTTIQWGDGTSSTGLVIQDVNRPGQFVVLGNHRYSAAGHFPITTTIVDTGGRLTYSTSRFTVTTTYVAEEPVATTAQAVVSTPPLVVAGRLDAASDTGLSQQDGITNDNTPTFAGTSAPGAVVRIFRGTDLATRQLIATGFTDANGVWQATVLDPLADGLYHSLVAEATAATDIGLAPATSALASLMVDTAGPTVTNLQFHRLLGQIKVSFQDDRSGLNPSRVADRASYVLTGRGPGSHRNRLFPITAITTTLADSPTGIQVFTLTSNNGRRLQGSRFTFTARADGITDLAGNSLDGEYTGRFPSGNAQPGGHFVVRLQPPRRIVAVSVPQRLIRPSRSWG
ncbi:Ig-like domain-containing protein [Singulisphaera sp. Ch08]|uniref:Ig-like domain-containing protein n=1 Tax=Singulisphaera sp. Ch08 TaxID=3120278 RepID=A0AAU7CKL2_9BACT